MAKKIIVNGQEIPDRSSKRKAYTRELYVPTRKKNFG
jgi:hypothetical protein